MPNSGSSSPQSPEALPDAIEDASNELPTLARLAIQRAQLSWIEIDCHIAWCDERIAAHVRADEQARAAAQLCGVGPVTASAVVASVGDFTQFKSGRQFGAWLGLVPGQHSSGGKASLGRITKRGDDDLRTLLVQGAKSAVMTAHKRSDRISQWLVQLLARVGWQKAVVALGQQERPHSVGSAGARPALRCKPRVHKAAGLDSVVAGFGRLNDRSKRFSIPR